MIRRINLIGAPNSGKSTLAARLFTEMKQQGIAGYELVLERAKPRVYNNMSMSDWSQFDLFCEQFRFEREFLANNNVGIVTDAPLELNAYYTLKAVPEIYGGLINILQKYDLDFPGINVFCLLPDEKFFQKSGRLHSHEESYKIQNEIFALMGKTFQIEYSFGFEPKYQDQIIKSIIARVSS